VIEWNFYVDMEFAFAAPWVVLVLAVLFECVNRARIARQQICRVYCSEDHVHIGVEDIEKQQKDVRVKTWSITLLTLFIMYPMLVQKAFGIFKCRLIEGEYYLVADVTLACYDDAWLPRAVMGAIGVAIYCIGIPALFFKLLNDNKDDLDHPDVTAKLGFVYAGYSSSFYLGEMVEMTRKMVMSGLVMFISPDSIMQVVVAVFMCAAFLAVQVVCNPYEDEAENKVNMWTLWGTALTILFGLLTMISEGACVSEDESADVSLMANMIIAVNVVVFFMIMWWMVFVIKSEIEGTIDMLKDVSLDLNKVQGKPQEKDAQTVSKPHDISKEDPIATKGDAFVPIMPPSKEEPRSLKQMNALDKAREQLMGEQLAKTKNATKIGKGIPDDIDSDELTELLIESFRRFDAKGAGYVDNPDAVENICLNVATKMRWVVSPMAIEDAVDDLEDKITQHGKTKFRLSLDEFLKWFHKTMKATPMSEHTKKKRFESEWL
jgi:hypothetical protein